MHIKIYNQKFSIGEIRKLRVGIASLLLHPSKVWNFLTVYLSRVAHKLSVKGLPPFLMIEPTSRCDMACPICFIRDRGKYPMGDMDFESYKKILDEVGKTLVTIALWGYGEPLLNKNLPQMISYARKMGIFTSVSTNALSLNEELIDALIDSGLDYLIISMDGASEETYAMYRSPGKFDSILENISRFAVKKRARRSTLPFVNLQFIVMKGNEHEIDKAKQLARDLNVDKLSLKKVWAFTKEEEHDFLPSNPRFHLKIYSDEMDTSICSRPWNTPFITWRGDVLVCCADFDYCHIMGNVFEEDGFRNVWNNQRFRSFRRAVIEDITRIDICRKCGAKNFADGFVND